MCTAACWSKSSLRLPEFMKDWLFWEDICKCLSSGQLWRGGVIFSSVLPLLLLYILPSLSTLSFCLFTSSDLCFLFSESLLVSPSLHLILYLTPHTHMLRQRRLAPYILTSCCKSCIENVEVFLREVWIISEFGCTLCSCLGSRPVFLQF